MHKSEWDRGYFGECVYSEMGHIENDRDTMENLFGDLLQFDVMFWCEWMTCLKVMSINRAKMEYEDSLFENNTIKSIPIKTVKLG